MAYTIVKSDGTVLTTIADGTINTTSSALGLPGRNYAGYGQTLDTNFVHVLENFADSTPPSNPLRGQLWFNTNLNTMYICPADGTSNANAWLALATTASGGTTTFGALTVTGTIQTDTMIANSTITADSISVRLATVNDTATILTGNINTVNANTVKTTSITAGSTSSTGALAGRWTINSAASGNALTINNGNIYAAGGIKVNPNNLYDLSGNVLTFQGTYTNANVSDYLTGANVGNINRFSGEIFPSKITTGALAGGGTVSGVWTLDGTARWQSTYADLAERFEADASYDAGTVVELGGDKEITSVQYELSEDVFGVVSDSAGYIMNAVAGPDETHPAIAVGGRVPVKIVGKVKKGQRLVSAGNGIARGAQRGEATAFNTIGRSLVNKTTDDVGIVEAFVTIK
jgi:hypothetical protein